MIRGALACKGCHGGTAFWQQSAHGQAGSITAQRNLLVDLDGKRLRLADGEVAFQFDREKLQILTKLDGRATITMTVAGVVGRGLMYGGGGQSLFIENPDGRYLLFPIEYNATSKTYCQTTDNGWMPISKKSTLRDCGWPPKRMLGSGPGAGCQNCHGSQIYVSFDERLGQYKTSLTSLAINCESCHGPGKRHVELMTNGQTKSDDIGLEPLELLSTREHVMVCMACHGNKANIREGYRTGENLDTYFTQQSMRHPSERSTSVNGQPLRFGYQQGHLYSPCYTDGSMTCVDCHNPHTLAYRDIYGQPLNGRFSDQQCTDCHPSKTSPAHQGHHQNKPLKCTDCHMPMHK